MFYAYLRPVDDEVGQPVLIGHGVAPVGSRYLQGSGGLEATGNELDLAIEGPGFFRVAGDAGQTEYTRAGNFRTDGGGQLVTPGGRHLLATTGRVTVPPGTVAVKVDAEGRITAESATGAPTLLGQLQLARFPNPAGLEAVGGNLFRATAASGSPGLATPGTGGVGRIAQGFIEGSNVQLIDEIVGLIAAQRAYELNSRAVQSADEMMHIASTLRR